MKLENRLTVCSEILTQYLPFISQMDMDIIKDDSAKINHPWLIKLRELTNQELINFDASRDYELLDSPDWIQLIHNIQKITKFEKINIANKDFTTYGKVKKQHELQCLFSHLDKLKNENVSVVDFGGGVGNLAFFLEDELNMRPLVIEKDFDLINKGRSRVEKNQSKIIFSEATVGSNFKINKADQLDLGIGLHTCGNFATDMLESCSINKIKNVLNFGCCYSKIRNDQYNLSSHSNKDLKFNSRALASATVGFGKTTQEIYDFRIRIMNYKFSFYHYVYKKHGIAEFCPMSNSRRSLYSLSFYEFMQKSFQKYYPGLALEDESEVVSFHQSKENKQINSYFQRYYAISRYLGQALEVYLLCDRALYLQEHGYDTEIKEFFDPQISPRNKGIIGVRRDLV